MKRSLPWLFAAFLWVTWIGGPALNLTAETKRASGSVIKGRVISAYGPVEGATVRIPGAEDAVITDQNGVFRLPLRIKKNRNIRITAGKEGWFNNGQFVQPGRRTEIYLNPLPRTDDQHYQFLPLTVCAQCHVKLTKTYNKSKMAHTTSNPKLLQMYNGTDAFDRSGKGPGFKLDNPDKDGDCIQCHAPSIAAADPKSHDLNKALYSPRLEWDGISCDYCHKVRRVTKSKNTASGYKAGLLRQKPSKGNSILVMGPYDDVSVPPMAASFNPVFQKGVFCSQCHSHLKDLGSKKWDWQKVYSKKEWEGFGLKDDKTLPLQTTYQEWKQWQDSLTAQDSNKGKKCQDCHMSWRKNMLPFDNHVVDDHARRMWGSYRSSQSINPHQFDGGTETQLKTAVSMEIESEVKGNILTTTVYITNTNGGHWVPTGEPMRSVLLVLDAVDENEKPLKRLSGEVMPEIAGRGDLSKGNYAGLSGVLFAKVLEDAAGNQHVPFWRAESIAIDNRIRPKSTVSYQWKFRLNNPDEEPSVTAKLFYRPVNKSLAQSKKWLVDDILITDAAW